MKKITILLLALILIISVANLSVSKPRSLKDPTEMPEDPIEPSISKEEQKSQILNELNVKSDYFTENTGQVGNDSVRYYIQGAGVWFLDDGVVFELKESLESGSQESRSRESTDPFYRLNPEFEPETPTPRKSVVLNLNFEGCNEVEPKGIGELHHKSNFFYGNDSTKWYSNVPNYQEIIYDNIYDNIDLKYYNSDKGLKYDFIVYPTGNLEDIRLKFEGINDLIINELDNLVIKTELGDIEDSNLFVYQNCDQSQKQVEGKFKLYNSMEYGFEILDDYDTNKILVIDPLINYSTFIGGASWENSQDIAIDTAGNAYVTGWTRSLDFPTTFGAYDRTYDGPNRIRDGFVFKLNSNGSALIYSTFIGGNWEDNCEDICVDANGNAYITGMTGSSDFPTTSNAFDFVNNCNHSNWDAFIFKLNQNGSSLIYSTFIGGDDGIELAYGISIDNFGNAFITGFSDSTNFYNSTEMFYNSNRPLGDVFVAKLNPQGSALLYSAFIGGNNTEVGYDITIDTYGNAYITGNTRSSDFPTTPGSYDRMFNGNIDCFILKLNQTGSSLLYSTFIGGNEQDSGFGIEVDFEGNAFVTGETRSIDFPTTPGAYDRTYNGKYLNHSFEVFCLKLNFNGSRLNYSTYIGGNDSDWPRDIRIDEEGNLYVTGCTCSLDFPVTPDAINSSFIGHSDVFVFKLNHNGSRLLYSSYIGGIRYDDGFGIEINSNSIYISGATSSIDFPTTPGAYNPTKNGGEDVFVIKIDFINATNTPPQILSFNATTVPEATPVIFTVNAIDLENDTLTYAFDFQNDGIFDIMTLNNTASYLWSDDYYGTAKVSVSDGNLSVEAITNITVYNVAPTVNLTTQFIKGNASLFVRIAGEKWHDIIVELYRSGSLIANNSLTRYPGSPNEQILDLSNYTLNSSAFYSVIIRYTPQDDPVNGQPNGATPCWVILNFSGQYEIRLHHTFNVKHPDTYVWEVNLTNVLLNQSNNVTFIVNSYDPGSDDITLFLDFGDGANITKFYANLNNTYPVLINDSFIHQYGSTGIFNITLIAKDDDGGVDTININIG